jgi:hypothetical protein
MIAGHDDLWFWKLVKKRSSRHELMRAGPLRQITGNSDDIGLDVVDSPYQRLDNRFINAAEMNVRKVYKCSH